MIIELFAWLVVLLEIGLSTAKLGLTPSLLQLIVLIVMLCSDLLIVASKAGETTNRTAPLIGLLLILLEPSAAVWVLLPLLLGSYLILHTTKSPLPLAKAGLGRSLAPLAAAGLVGSLYGEGVADQVLVATTFVFFSVFIVPTAEELRLTLLQLLCAPGVALAGLFLAQRSPFLLLCLIPVVAVVSLGRDESFPVLMKMRRALNLSKHKLQAQERKLKTYSKILNAAQMMSTQMTESELDSALQKSLRICGIRGGKLERSKGKNSISLAEQSYLALPSGLDEESRTVARILGRIYCDSKKRVQLHSQVLEALEETRRSQAQTLAASRLAAIGRLAAGVAHEVNTPMGAIILATDLGEQFLQRDVEKARFQLEQIRLSSENVQKSVRRLLQYAQPDRYQSDGWFSADEVLQDSLQLNSFQFKKSKAEIKINFPPDLELQGKKYDLHLLASNLTLNALQACVGIESPKVLLRGDVQQDDSFLLEVSDNGPGVPQELADEIFEPFFTTKPSGEGNGLGLFLARQAAESLGGAIRYRPNHPQGALFQVRFPPGTFRGECFG